MSRFKRAFRLLLSATALVFAVLLVVVLTNTLLFTSKQIAVAPIRKETLDENLAALRLSKALQFRTVSHQEPSSFDAEAFLGLHAHLAEAYPKVHATLQREVVGDYSLLFRWKGSDPLRKPILLMSHLDVVPVEPGTESRWKYPPFDGRIADGHIWGRGALDIKCGVMGILEAVELLLDEQFAPACDIYLAFGHDEEVGGTNGNARIAVMLRERGVRLQYVLDEGGIIADGIIPGVSAPVAFVSVAEKGYVSVKLTANAKRIAKATGEDLEGHPSMPPPQTTVGIIAAAVHRLETNAFPTRLGGATSLMLDYLGPEMPFAKRVALANPWLFGPLIKRQLAAQPATSATIRTTTAATMIGGGVTDNLLPAEAWAVLNFRILPGETLDDVLEHVRAIINDQRVEIELHGVHTEPSVISDTESADFETLHKTIRQVFASVVVAPGLGTVATDSRHYEKITENTFRFVPTRMIAEDLPRVHGTNERISVQNYGEVIRFFIQQIRNSAS